MRGSEWPGWLTVSGFIVCTRYLSRSGTWQLMVCASECAAHLAAVFTYVLLLFSTVRTTPPNNTHCTVVASVSASASATASAAADCASSHSVQQPSRAPTLPFLLFFVPVAVAVVALVLVVFAQIV